MLYVFLMYALFASIFPIGKITLEYVSPYFLTAIRMLLAGAIILLYQYLRNRKDCYLHKKHIPHLLGITVFNVFITNSFEFWALQYLGAGLTSLIYTLTIFCSMLLAYLFFNEVMNYRKWLGLSIGLSGAVAIFWHQSDSQEAILSLPEAMMCIASVTAAIGWFMVKVLRVQYDYPINMINAVSFLGGGVISLCVSLVFEQWSPVPVFEWQPFLMGVLYIALIHNVLCYTIYAKSLNRFSITFMSYAGITNPLFAALISWFLLGETVGVHFFVALCFVILGLYLFYKEESLVTNVLETSGKKTTSTKWLGIEKTKGLYL